MNEYLCVSFFFFSLLSFCLSILFPWFYPLVIEKHGEKLLLLSFLLIFFSHTFPVNFWEVSFSANAYMSRNISYESEVLLIIQLLIFLSLVLSWITNCSSLTLIFFALSSKHYQQALMMYLLPRNENFSVLLSFAVTTWDERHM